MQLPEGLTPIPHHPSYMLRADGRVWSLRTDCWLTETGGEWRMPDGRRVKFDGTIYRVRDLVSLVLGDQSAFLDRAWAERRAWEERSASWAPRPFDGHDE